MKEYNGHRSWNAWNVALWLGNDEGLYHAARAAWRRGKANAARAARLLMQDLPERTPDGAHYNALCVRLALDGLFGEDA
jgi:hypothetical protein